MEPQYDENEQRVLSSPSKESTETPLGPSLVKEKMASNARTPSALSAFPPKVVCEIAKQVVPSLYQTDMQHLSLDTVEWSIHVLVEVICLLLPKSHCEAHPKASKTSVIDHSQKFGKDPQPIESNVGAKNSQANIAFDCIDILVLWIGLRTSSPRVIVDNPSRFLPNIIHHIVLTFQEGCLRPNGPQCKRIISTLKNLATTCQDEDTAVVALRGLLAIANDLVLSSSADILAQQVSDDLLPALLEAWIKSYATGRIDDSGWQELTLCYRCWLCKKKPVTWWGLVTCRLTQRIVDVLYGQSNGERSRLKPTTEKESFEWVVETMPLPKLSRCWYGTLHLISTHGNLSPNNIPPSIFIDIMDSVTAFVRIFLDVQSFRAPPSINSMLSLFGPWLFSAASPSTGSVYIDAQARALGALTNIFAARHIEPPQADYLDRFVGLICLGLQNEIISQEIILNATHLFVCPMDCIWLTLPSFVSVIRRVLFSNPMSRAVRRAAASILQTIVCIPNHVGNVPMDGLVISFDDTLASESWSPPMQLQKFSSFTRQLGILCLDALQTEKDEAILQILINALYTVVFDDETKRASNRANKMLQISPERIADVSSSKHKPLPPLLIVSALRLLVNLLCKLHWPTAVQLSALEAVRGFSRLFSIVMEADSTVVPDLILGLCAFIEVQLGQPRQKHTRKLHTSIVAAYHCLLAWMSPYWGCHSSGSVLSTVLRVVMCGLVGTSSSISDRFQSSVDSCWILSKGPPRRKRQISEGDIAVTSPSYRVQEAASLLLRKLHSAKFSETQISNTAFSSEEEFRLWLDITTDKRYFGIGMHTILGIVESKQPLGPTYVVVRDELGRTIWTICPEWQGTQKQHSKHEPNFCSSQAKARASFAQQTPKCSSSSTTPTLTMSNFSFPPLCATSFNALLEQLTDTTNPQVCLKSTESELCKLIEQHRVSELSHALDQDEIVFPEARTAPIRNPCYSIAQQFFVSLYGSNFLSRDDVNNDELSILTVNDSLKSALIELDRIPLGDSITVRVGYVNTDGKLISETSQAMENISDEFFAFYHDLRSSEPIGYQEADVDFRVSAMKPQPALVVSDTVQMSFSLFNVGKRDKSGSEYVVLWCASQNCLFHQQHIAAPLLETGACLVLFVTQQPTGVLVVNKYTTQGDLLAGPLAQITIVTEHVLAESLRVTITNTFLRKSMADDRHVFPTVVRKKEVKEIITSLSVEKTSQLGNLMDFLYPTTS